MAPTHNSRSGLTGFFTNTGLSTPRRESANACMAKGFALVRAPIQRMSTSYFSASSTCSGVATSVATFMPVSFFTSCSQGKAFSPLPSKPPGFVRGFHTPARKLWHPSSFSWRAVVITCSSVSAEHGPAMTNGRSLSAGRFSFSNSNSIRTLSPLPLEGECRMSCGEVFYVYCFYYFCSICSKGYISRPIGRAWGGSP